jgi:hypothetical protein
MKSEAQRAAESAILDKLYDRVQRALVPFGIEDGRSPGDFWIHEDYWGHPQLKVYVDVKMIRPAVVDALRSTLIDLPNWEIVFAVAVRGTENRLPDMGLRIRRDEVLDGLKRDFLPEPYRSFSCRDLRPERPDEIPSE